MTDKPTSKATTAQAPAPTNMDALPPGGGSYTRQPDGTLLPASAPADLETSATPE